jgi:hypothetical protein
VACPVRSDEAPEPARLPGPESALMTLVVLAINDPENECGLYTPGLKTCQRSGSPDIRETAVIFLQLLMRNGQPKTRRAVKFFSANFSASDG